MIELVRYMVEVWDKKRQVWEVIRTSASLENCLSYVVSNDGAWYRFTMNRETLKVEVVE